MYKSVLLSIICAGCAFAQTESTPGKDVTIQLKDPGELAPKNLFYFRTGLVGSTRPVTGAPYSAQSTTDRLQVLADGNRIEQTTSGNIARDSQGRVRNEAIVAGIALPTGDAPHLITINDPVAGYTYTLDSDHKIAFKLPMPKNAAFDTATGNVPGVPGHVVSARSGEMGVKQVQIGTMGGPAGAVITKLDDASECHEGRSRQADYGRHPCARDTDHPNDSRRQYR
jgi:hypothetical protein